MATEVSSSINLFYCYAREDQNLRDELDTHLQGLHRSYLITSWYDGQLFPGASWEQEIETHLDTADVILLLVSPAFMKSDYCYGKEMQRAIERHQANLARVVPILLRPVDWIDAPFAHLQMLPANASPITLWSNRDEAFVNVAKGIRHVVNDLLAQHAKSRQLHSDLLQQKRKQTKQEELVRQERILDASKTLRDRVDLSQSQKWPALHPDWQEDRGRDDFMLGGPNISTLERGSSAAQSEEKDDEKSFILKFVLLGLVVGSLSTLAPIFSVAFATHNSFTAFLVGMASALCACISMIVAVALSDDGDTTGRSNPFIRNGVTGFMTFISGVGHVLPFLIPNVQLALTTAYVVVAIELLVIASIRHWFFGTNWLLSIIQVVGGGALVFLVALLLGNA